MHRRFIRLVVAVAVSIAGLLMIPSGAASARPRGNAHLYGATYTLQNYFDSASLGAGRIPFFDAQAGRIGPHIEIPQVTKYIYAIDFKRDSIAMTWNTDPSWDTFEPYVGAGLGMDAATAAASGIADQYEIKFSKPVAGLRVWADPHQPIVPLVTVVDQYTIVISIPGGTVIGDDRGALIRFSRGS